MQGVGVDRHGRAVGVASEERELGPTGRTQAEVARRVHQRKRGPAIMDVHIMRQPARVLRQSCRRSRVRWAGPQRPGDGACSAVGWSGAFSAQTRAADPYPRSSSDAAKRSAGFAMRHNGGLGQAELELIHRSITRLQPPLAAPSAHPNHHADEWRQRAADDGGERSLKWVNLKGVRVERRRGRAHAVMDYVGAVCLDVRRELRE